MLSEIDSTATWAKYPLSGDNGRERPEVAFSPPEDVPESDEGSFSFFGDDGFDFADLIDVVNPLQHVPLVSTLYRQATEDNIGVAPRVMGAALFFGPLGLAGALANVALAESTGKDFGDHVVGWMQPDEAASADVADNAPASSPFDNDDPISVWARSEVDWAKRQAGAGGYAPEAQPDTFIPDARPFLRGEDQLATIGAAVLSDDPRAAANAYRVAAGLSNGHG